VIGLLLEYLAIDLLRIPQPPGLMILNRQFEGLLNRHRAHCAARESWRTTLSFPRRSFKSDLLFTVDLLGSCPNAPLFPHFSIRRLNILREAWGIHQQRLPHTLP